MVNIPALFSIPVALYSLFIMSVIALWTPFKRPIVPIIGLLTLFLALFTKIYDWFVVAEIALLLFLTILVETANKPYIKWLAIAATFALAFSMSRHLLPGFHNLLVIKSITVTPDAVPFTMYWNFDKPWVALVLLFPVSLYSAKFAGKISHVLMVFLAAIIVLLALSYALGYIHYEFKVPEFLLLWMFNNLFITCVAEEALFRGFLQRHLSTIMPPLSAIASAALLFGLLHYWGGWKYMVLSAVAGLFYGYQYHYTNRLELSILTHFFLNLTHILFFTYPALQSAF